MLVLLAGAVIPALPVPTAFAAGSWDNTGSLLVGRYNPAAVTLQDGKVLLVGGHTGGNVNDDESELYNPATRTWTSAGVMPNKNQEPAAALLHDGRVLVAGTTNRFNSQLYDPALGIWTQTGPWGSGGGHLFATTTVLSNGKVLLAGGVDTNSVDLFDPATSSYSFIGGLTSPRTGHTAVLLNNGKVLIAGGGGCVCGDSRDRETFATAELYDPSNGSFTLTGSMSIPRIGHGAALLPDGRVLVAGGGLNPQRYTGTGDPSTTAEIYDPATGTWSITGSLNAARFPGTQHFQTLPSGQVMAIGNDATGTSELFDPVTGTWSAVTNLAQAQCGGATAALQDGRILLASGTDCTSPDNKLTAAQIYTPAPPQNITGTVYVDTNANGIKDGSEQGYAGATVHLLSGPGFGLNMTDISDITDANGTYTITGFAPDAEKYLKIDIPSGYIGTTTGIIGLPGFTGDFTQDFGIGAPPVLPTVFGDDFTDTDGTPLTTHNSAWTAHQSVPEIRNNNLHTTAVADPVGPYAYVLTDQCMSIDIQTPTQGILALHARQEPNGGMGGYGSDFNTNPSLNYYEVSLYKATNGDRYFPGGFSIPKVMLGSGWHTFKLCTIGDRVSSYLDNALMIKATDPDWTQGVSHFGLSPDHFVDNFKLNGLIAGPPPPPVYAVSTNTRNTFGNNNIVATIGASGIPAGDTAHVSVATGTFAGATGCSDSKGNTYSVAADRNSGQGRIFVCTSHLATSLTAGDTVTATYPGFSGISVVSVNAVSAATSSGVVTAASSANGNSASPNSGSITVGGPAVLFGTIGHNSTPSLTPGSGYTLIGQVSGGSGSGKRTLSPEFRLVSGAGSYNANATISNGGQFWQAALVGYAGN